MEIDNNLVDEFKNLNPDSVEFTKKCFNLIEEIKNKQLTILELIEQLGPLLIDKFSDKRELGIWVLSTVLDKLPSNHFDENQLKYICSFYSDRLKDHHQVIPAVLVGILSLSKFEKFPNGACSDILRALFLNVSCQQQREADRYKIYEIFKIFLTKHQSELLSMGLDFIYGVISAIDGERNPKNLIFLFNWYPTFLQTVSLGHLAEEAFEVLSCYFPVDFKAPTQDPNAISRDQLANSLAPCLTAIPEFAEFCFPLALEKFQSSLEIAKLDALKLIELGCLNFSSNSYRLHSTEIWSQIQKEIFSNPNAEIESACFTTLTAVLAKISEDTNFSVTLKDISDTVKGNLLPDSRLFIPSIKLFLSVARACRLSADFTTNEIVPILINTYNITVTPQSRGIILSYLVEFFIIYRDYHNEIQLVELNEIPVLYLKSCFDENEDIQIIGFTGLYKISRFLSLDVRVSIYNNLEDFLMKSTSDVRKTIFKFLAELAKLYPNEIKEYLFDNLTITNELLLENYLQGLTILVTQNFFTKLIVESLFKYLSKSVSFGCIVIRVLRLIIQESVNDLYLETILLDCNTISVMIDWVLTNESYLDRLCLEDVSVILSSLVVNQTSDKQKVIITKELNKLEVPLKPKFVFILYGLLSHLRRDVEIDYKLLDELKEFIRFGDESIKFIAAQLLANLLNKSSDQIICNFIKKIHEDTDLVLLTWSTKALLTRSHPLADGLLTKLLELLELNASVSECYRVLLNDNFNCLSSRSYSLRALLYQQKYFTLITNQLCGNYKPEWKSFLVAFGYLLEFTPKQIILLQFPKIFKFIILCLDECQQAEILLTILEILKDFIVGKVEFVEEHIADFLTRFLRLSSFDKSMKVRIVALKCLQECTTCCPVYKLLPYKFEVLRVLGKVVDDKKRIVRREAVEARSLWFILDSQL